MSRHIVFAAGGTAGHLEPALNTADALRRIDPNIDVSFLGGSRGLETSLVPARGYELAVIDAVPMPRRVSISAATFPLHTARGIRGASAHLRRVSADAVVGFGGYAAVPGYLAARRTRLPLIVHEANSRAGFANLLGARLTPHVSSVHAGVLPHAKHMALPIRPSIDSLDRPASRQRAREHWGLSQEDPVVLVFGGSQGARRINEVIAGSVDVLTASGVQILHAVGSRNELPAAQPGYVPLSYVERMEDAYAAADLVVCRSGAMTCAEVTAVGIPAIFVPLPIGNGEQAGNSAPIVAVGGALQIPDADISAEWLTDTVINLVQDEGKLAAMSEASAGLGEHRVDEQMAQWILRVAEG